MSNTATPLCCSTESRYVFNGNSCQYFYCDECKLEVTAKEGPKVETVEVKVGTPPPDYPDLTVTWY